MQCYYANVSIRSEDALAGEIDLDQLLLKRRKQRIFDNNLTINR